MNYRYPGPRRVITQGPSRGRWTISRDEADAGVVADEFQIAQKTHKKQCIVTLGSLQRDFFLLFEGRLARNDRFWDHFWKGACQKCFQYISFRLRHPSKSQKHVARYSNSRFAYARQHFALKSRVSSTRNANFALEAEAKALERPRPAKTLTWRQCTHGRQTNFAKFYIYKI